MLDTTIFMRILGGDVDGSIARIHAGADYEKWSDIDSVSFGVSRQTQRDSEQGGELPELSACTITKKPDLATTRLMRLARTQETFTLEIHICTTADGKIEPYQLFLAEECRLVSMAFALQGEDPPSETLSFHLERLLMSFAELSIGNKITVGGPMRETVVDSSARRA